MPDSRGSNLKDREMYEELRKDGASKQKAARISNAAASRGPSAVGRKGEKSGDYDDLRNPLTGTAPRRTRKKEDFQ